MKIFIRLFKSIRKSNEVSGSKLRFYYIHLEERGRYYKVEVIAKSHEDAARIYKEKPYICIKKEISSIEYDAVKSLL